MAESLIHGFIVYLADNVLVMLMATTAGTLGLTLFSSQDLITQQLLGIVFNWVLATGLYFYAARMFHKATDEAEPDSESNSDVESKMLGFIKGDATSGYSHMLAMLPWVIIVPMVNLPVLIMSEEKKYFDDKADGALWLSQFGVFMAFLLAAIFSSRIYAGLPDCGAPCESYPTFLMNSFNHSMLSCAGKALHLLECVQYNALAGENATHLQARVCKAVFLTGITWFLLVHTWPRLSADTLHNRLFKTTITTITVYSWAFSFINDLWTAFADEHIVVWYWVLMGVCCLVALLLAYVSDGNFYGGPSDRGAGFGLMLCWVIDFGVWWGWSSIMTTADTNAKGKQLNFWSLFFVNAGILVAIIVATVMVYMCADLQTLESHSSQRHRLTHHHKHA